MNIAVSACLLGCPCRYDGKSCSSTAAMKLALKHTLVPVCPETMGGLESPRDPAELQNRRAINRSGEDVTEAFETGSEAALDAVRKTGCTAAVLMQRSPSCGCGRIYDGTFQSVLIEGDGLFTRKLKKEQIQTVSIDELEAHPDIFDGETGFKSTECPGIFSK